MATWLNKIKKLLSYYLGTQDDKYITTENGLRLWIVDHEYVDRAKNTSSWISRTKE